MAASGQHLDPGENQEGSEKQEQPGCLDPQRRADANQDADPENARCKDPVLHLPRKRKAREEERDDEDVVECERPCLGNRLQTGRTTGSPMSPVAETLAQPPRAGGSRTIGGPNHSSNLPQRRSHTVIRHGRVGRLIGVAARGARIRLGWRCFATRRYQDRVRKTSFAARRGSGLE